MEYVVTLDINTDDDFYTETPDLVNGIARTRHSSIESAFDETQERLRRILRNLKVHLTASYSDESYCDYTPDRYKMASGNFCKIYRAIGKARKNGKTSLNYYRSVGNYSFRCTIEKIE
jgi:hypothetical protein